MFSVSSLPHQAAQMTRGWCANSQATFNTILLGLPAAEGATLIEKISLIGSKTVTKNGAGKMIDKIN
jgi:hypothetical protein